MNISEWRESVLSGSKRFAVPIMTHPGIEIIGKTIVEAVSDGETQFQAIKAIQDKFPVDAATMIMDLTVEAEAFGSKIRLSEHEIPTVIGRLVTDYQTIQELHIPSLGTARVPQYLKAVRLAVENIKDKPVFAGCIGSFSLAGRLFGITEIMTSIFIEPEIIKPLLEKCTTFLLSYVKALKSTGAHGILMAEPAAGLLSAEMCDEFSSVYVKKVVDEVQDDDFLFILHNCGNMGQVTKSMISTGAMGLHFGNKVDMVDVLEEIPDNVLAFGNLDPVGVFKSGTPESVFITTSELLEKTAGHRNFIISSGCDTPPGLPIENTQAFFQGVRSFNAQD